MKIEVGQVISQIISFLIMLWILKRFAWKPLLKVLSDRKERIKTEFAEIESQKAELAKLTKEYDQKIRDIDVLAHAKMKEAAEKGNQIAQSIQEQAQAQARAIIQKAKESSANEVQKAKLELKQQVVDMVFDVTEKMLKVDLDQDKQKKLILEFVNKTGLN